jgi:hypothetical protein
MAAAITGVNDRAIFQPTERGEMDRFGIDMITREEMVPAGNLGLLLRAQGSRHPVFSNMTVSRRTYQLVAASTFYKVTYLYEGFIERKPDPTYELTGSVREEPIEIHEDFETLAGTPSEPENGAIFIDPETWKQTSDDAKGVFERFGDGDLAGASTFRLPAAIWTKVSFETSKPSNAVDLGKVDDPPGNPPTFPGGKDWMVVGYSFRQRGAVYEVRQQWELSGRGGWNTLIYGTA